MHVEGVLANNDYILNGCYIEITSNCNLRCIHCYNESGELRDQISVEAFKNVLGCYDNPKKASITLSGGEPLLHPQVWKFIDMMLESGILARNILLITNATCITDDVANMLAEKHVSVQVSLNGSRAELHDSICGKGNFERTMAGLQRLLSKHANMVIVRNMMNKQNMNDNWEMYNIDKPQERRKATGTGGIPPENIRLRRTLTTEYLQLSLCYGVRDRMSIETAGFTGWR